MNKICAVIVAYYPDETLFTSVLDSIKPQVDNVVIVNNSEIITGQEWLEESSSDGVFLINLNANAGLGAAHNIGIQWAFDHEANFVLIMDQDSIAGDRMVELQLAAFLDIENKGEKVAVVGPWLNNDDHLASFHFAGLIRGGVFKRIAKSNSPIEVDVLISSGSLISQCALNDIGRMNEALFIDNIDIDWCFRAGYLGYAKFVHPDAVMVHSLGDSSLEFNFFRKIRFAIHKPIRQYYSTRNRVWLYFQAYTPLQWIFKDVGRLIGKLMVSVFFFPNKVQNFQMIMRGLKDGLTKSF